MRASASESEAGPRPETFVERPLPAASRPGGPPRQRLVLGALVTLAALQFLRTARPANAYATAHWLFTYEHGFTRRGLVGTLFAPVVRAVNPETARWWITCLGLLAIVGFLGAVVTVVTRGWRAEAPDHPWLLVPAAFLASPTVVWLCHLVGYFDVLLLLLGLAMVQCLRGSANALVLGALCVAGTLTHELFVVLVVPAMLLVALVRAATRWSEDGPWGLVPAGVVLGSSAAACLAAVLSSPDVNSLRSSAFATEIVQAGDNVALFYALVHSVDHARTEMASTLWHSQDALVGLALGVLAYLPFLCLAFADVGPRLRALRLSRNLTWALATSGLAVVATPLLIHLVAWDTERLNSYVGAAGFLLWFGLRRLPALPEPAKSWSPGGWMLSGALAISFGLVATPNLMDGEQVAGYPALFTRWASKFDLPARATYRGLGPTEPLFDNAGFERGSLRGWTPTGEAFASQPTYGDNTVVRGASSAPDGQWWVGTFEDNPRPDRITGTVQGDAPRGTLVSDPFRVLHPTIVFKLGGGRDAKRLFVSFVVDGEEVARFTGERTEHMRPVTLDVRPYLGREMHIEIVDASSQGWGHLNVDGFAYLE